MLTGDKRFFLNFVKTLSIQRRRRVRNFLAPLIRDKMGVRGREGKMLVEVFPFLDSRVSELTSEDLETLSNKVLQIVESKRFSFKNLRFYVFPEVYMPSDDTFLLASHLAFDEGERILDLGTGCGILGILAAEKGGRVVAVDVNPYAVECAKLNAKLNGLSGKVEVREGSLFDPIAADERFDLILFNPPYLPEEKNYGSSWLERAWDGGPSGRRWIDRFLEDFPPYLREGGRVLLVQSSLSNPQETTRKLEKRSFKAEVVAEEKLDFEKLMVIRARKRNEN